MSATELPARRKVQTELLWDGVADAALLWASPLHGEQHANRVTATALQLAELTPGADAMVAFCFGVLHDSQRRSEGSDPRHGERAAELAAVLHRRGTLRLSAAQVATLTPALRFHTSEVASTDPTVGVCLDADRLNLQRLGIQPRADLLSTPAALGLADWVRSTLEEFVPWPRLGEAAGYPTR